MKIFLLKENRAYENCYFVEEYANRDEAVKHIDGNYDCKFIEGEELKLGLVSINI